MRRALIIATENYTESRFARLPGTAEDARGLERVLADPAIGAFDVTILHDADVRAAGSEVLDFFHDAQPEDLLLLHVSGHGLRDENGDLYFLNSDTEFGRLWVTALAARDVAREMRNSAAKQIIVLLDCCYSGAFTRSDGGRGRAAADMDDALRVRGRIVITASTAVQMSYERTDTDPADVRSGLFTRAVVRGLETGDADLDGDGLIDSNELYRYVLRSVRREAGPRQTPTYSADNLQGSLHIATSVRGPRTVRRGESDDFPGLDTVLRTWADRIRPVPRGPMPRRVAAALLTALVLLCGCGTQADSRIAGGLCSTPTQVRVATSQAGLAAYRDVADEFESWVAGQSHGCRSVDLYLFPATADEMVTGLRTGWTGHGERQQRSLRDVGPHPDVWLPEASSDVPPEDDDLEDVLDQVVTLAQTPVVLGVPQAAAKAVDESQRRATRSWSELFAMASQPAGSTPAGEPAGQGWGVVRGDPTASVAARMATTKLYRDGAIGPAAARGEVEKWIEQALDAAGYPIGDDAGLLCRQQEIHRRAPGAATPAVILTEQALVRFNQGQPTAGSCTRPSPFLDTDRLLAFYPSDTPAVRQVLVHLRWPDSVQGRNTRAYAQWFARWLKTAPGREALLRAGLRPFAHDIKGPMGAANGVLDDWPFARVTRDEPDAQTRKKVAELHEGARRPGRFLVALDASGSMNTVTADPDRTRFEMSIAAVEQAVTRMGGRDQFGLVTFSGAGSRPVREVIGITRQSAQPSGSVSRKAARIRPAGDTPLYEAIRQGADRLRAGSATGDHLRTLVVLTDGKDTSGLSGPSAAETSGVRVFIITVGDVSCADPALKRLATDNAGRCFDAGPDSVENVLSGMFRAIWDAREN